MALTQRTAVKQLVQMCIETIARNFVRVSPNLFTSKIEAKHINIIIDMLDIDKIPIELAGRLIKDERFWKRSCNTTYFVINTLLSKKHGARYFFEEFISRQIESLEEKELQSFYDVVSIFCDEPWYDICLCLKKIDEQVLYF